ncbi:MAG: cardiolipin synthase [Clostridia bacterium]|nr:cardiolipin synthase [Clostridia bacterium]
MKNKPKHGIRIPTRIIISAFLLLIQFGFLFASLYNVTWHSTGLYVLSMFLGILTVVIIINRRSNPDHKIAWIVFILLFPVFGITVFLLWGGGRIMPIIKKRMRICEARYLRYLRDDETVRDKLKYYDLIHSRQADYLTGESGYPLYDKTSTEYLSPGEKFFPRLLQELEAAEKYIYIEFFILAEGYMWDQMHEILSRKVKEGVEVKIIFDDFGSIKRQNRGFVSKLKSEGIEVTAFNPINPIMNIFMNNRNHRKIIVIDGKTAITGGINIGDEYINKIERFGYWLDCAVIIKGKAVTSFLAMFCCMWEFSTHKRIPIKKHIAECSSEDDGFVIPYSDDPLTEKNPAEGLYMQILNTAQRYVYIMTPYLIIDNNMKSALKMAARSGIDIRIITPFVPDKTYAHNVTQYNYLELLEAGIKIYEYTPGFVHSKLFISDDKVATVGTVNMDYRSFVFHFECGAWICDNSTVLDIRDHFNETLQQCREIKLEKWKKRPILLRMKQAILHIFAPFM